MFEKYIKNCFLLLGLNISMMCYSSLPGAVATQMPDTYPHAIETWVDGTLVHVVTNQTLTANQIANIANNDAGHMQEIESRHPLSNTQNSATDTQADCLGCYPHKMKACELAGNMTIWCWLWCPLVSIIHKDCGCRYCSNCHKAYSDCNYGCLCWDTCSEETE